MTLNFSLDTIQGTAFSPDGKILIVVGNSPSVFVTDLSLGKTKVVDTDLKAISAVAFSPDGSKWAIGGSNGRVRVYTTSTMTRAGGHIAHKAPITSVAFTPSGDAVLGGDSAGKLSSASFSKASMLHLWRSAYGPIHCIVPSPWANLIAVGSGDSLRLYEPGRNPKISAFGCGHVSIIRFSPVNRAFIALVVGAELVWFDMEQDKEFARNQFSEKILGFDWRASGDRPNLDLVIALENGELFSLNPTDLDHHSILADESERIIALQFQPAPIELSPQLLPARPPARKEAPPSDPEPIPAAKAPKAKPVRKDDNGDEPIRKPPTDPDLPDLTVGPQRPSAPTKEPAIPTVDDAEPSPRQPLSISPRQDIRPLPLPDVRPSPPPPIAGFHLERSPEAAAPIELDMDLSHLSPENRELIQIVAANIAEAKEQLLEEMTRHLNSIHLDLLCRFRQISDKIDHLKRTQK
jgi:hypothetical protein